MSIYLTSGLTETKKTCCTFCDTVYERSGYKTFWFITTFGSYNRFHLDITLVDLSLLTLAVHQCPDASIVVEATPSVSNVGLYIIILP